jgi:hypothetical protein
MEISSVSISFGPVLPLHRRAPTGGASVQHALRSLEAGEKSWTSIDSVDADSTRAARG